MNLICKIFGHKNSAQKKYKIKGYRVFYGASNWWNCMRCGEPTQKFYFSGDSLSEEEKV